MALNWRLFALASQLLTLLHAHPVADANSLSTSSESCHEHERSALLQFKRSFVIDRSASSSDAAYPKFSTWKLGGESRNCCSWDGVMCDEKTGHVISIDLASSCLYGSINSTSSLFRLVHIEELILSDNDFNFSRIPSGVGRLSFLTYLDLSNSRFSGQIPSEISYLFRLTYLDLSANTTDPSRGGLLELKNPSLSSLIRNLTNLETLSLASAHIPSIFPSFLANFFSLRSLDLSYCGVYGKFPSSIFRLPQIKFLDVSGNNNLTGYLPEFDEGSVLEYLSVSDTGFSGRIPSSIEKLNLLSLLYLDGCKFLRPLPSSLGKLTQLVELYLGGNHLGGYFPSFLQNLTQLYILDLSGNQMIGPIPSWLGKFDQLTLLYLDDNELSGPIPSSFQNITQLTELFLQMNQLTGSIPSSLGNITELTSIFLRHNQLHGPFPHALSKLTNLEILDLGNNNLSGSVKFDMFFDMKHLDSLNLCYSGLSVIFGQRNRNTTVSKFKDLALCHCNLTEFPSFIRYQNELEGLELPDNEIHGQVPKWMWNTSIDSLLMLDLSNNFLATFQEPPKKLILPWRRLRIISLGSNMLQGPLPIPPPSIVQYVVSNNKLSGEISPSLCKLSSVWMLDLSNNSLTGRVPQCLGNFSDSLKVLSLRNNFFSGLIPSLVCSHGSKLRVLDLSHNQFQGKLPRSLSTCMALESLDVKGNQLVDVFPAWLGNLPKLKLLILGRNRFYGVMGKPSKSSEYPRLRVIDLSSNNFTGDLPSEYISIWTAMKASTVNSSYLEVNESINVGDDYDAVHGGYSYSFTIMNKGREINYERIQSAFAAIDFSSNQFSGGIPDIIGSLEDLHSLNLSNNKITGPIPQSLKNLSKLESLDLSDNELSGGIPQQLVQLNFLQNFDVSHNNLSGPIPQGNQFYTFENSSFEGNRGLCGKPLSRECSNSKPSHPPVVQDDNNHSGFEIEFDWKFIFAGFISGIVIGFSLGDIVIMKRSRFVKIVWTRLIMTRRQRRIH